MSRILNSIPLLYVLMLLPGRISIWDIYENNWYYPQMMQESGELSVWFLIASMAVTPITILIARLKRGRKFGAWLLRRRKHFGLTAFIFAGVHAFHYIREVGGLSVAWLEAFDLELAVGWIGFIIFLALAITSNRISTQRLGKAWKPLHRLTYVAAAMIFWHWFLFDLAVQRLWVAVALLVGIKLIHIGLRYVLTRPRRPSPTQST